MKDYGALNAHNIGVIVKEMVRRVVLLIREHRLTFEVSEKRGYDGRLDDMVTNADKAAQDIYISMIRENFPGFGVLAEEEHLTIEPSDEFKDVYFTVDPLDGTKAFVRNQSQGIGTMIALVSGAEVISAYVGDIMTEEVYGFRPESSAVHRISEFGRAVELQPAKKPISESYIALREDPRTYSDRAQNVISNFKSITVEGGSIGTHAARLWKGVMGALLLPPAHETPWDSTPVFGISKKLGYRFYSITEKGLTPYEGLLPKKPEKREYELLIAPPEMEELL